ncbi:dihydrolipoamide acetyltransferase family protein [Brachybacterium saurashtrense]|uniref:Dihydrolipoamide acetyltransferase component of pyruvate dehydrogenase complex n=1 Tax=Brachybacterium saurashtrense TaxID=556288 RepID=A0A345YRX0_9MICO|nr:dihydrolipoamide acetyltransferase family protein [Brachybacterium saurashtrense]AXK46672.1 2-oxo acid dehydrogenase subunit E2 [Brachybacterium saurashtrense]RRR22386.1 2-oxo acid dehydrogenase subunit E2 [Brachybacterium saurashtrense]
MSDFRLPDLGEGLTEATIVAWHVAVGDEVTRNQPLAEVETAKALVELPSPRAGRVAALHAAEGETLAVGTPLIGFEEVAASGATQPSPEPAPSAAEETPARPQRQQVLVGYGPVLPGTGRPRRRPRAFATEPYRGRTAEEAAHERPRAMPPVRRRARDLGVDLAAVHGTGPGGRILRTDVEACADDARGGSCSCGGTGAAGETGGAAGTTAVAASGTGRRTSTRTPVTGLRRETARAMATSASTAPHASVHTTVDVTDTLERLRTPGRDAGRTSFLGAVCRALVPAAARTPEANARFDEEAGEIELFDEVDLGIAVATERGLVVATVPGASTLGGAALTEAIAAQAARAREGALTPAELTGSTLTVTNVGVFGVEGGVPILNPGQSTILALGALRSRPWEHRGGIALRTVVTLTLSFDHRVLDGAEASRFLMDIADVLADPATLLTR